MSEYKIEIDKFLHLPEKQDKALITFLHDYNFSL